MKIKHSYYYFIVYINKYLPYIGYSLYIYML
nr:MAG TPA: hypothetical protein [Crassvirales sp.]